MMDALVEDYFRYDELAQMEAVQGIRYNITGSDTEVIEFRELDEVPRARELISNIEICEKENQSPDQTDIMWNRNTFFHKNNFWPVTAYIFFSSNAKSKFFFGQLGHLPRSGTNKDSEFILMQKQMYS